LENLLLFADAEECLWEFCPGRNAIVCLVRVESGIGVVKVGSKDSVKNTCLLFIVSNQTGVRSTKCRNGLIFLGKCLEQFPVGFWIGGVSAFKKSLLGFPDLFSNAISGKLILVEFVVIACSFIGFE